MTRTEAMVVRKQVVVNAVITQAFTAFTERFGDFKPPEHNLLRAPIAETVFEPRVGGHIYDRATDGSEGVPTWTHPATSSVSAGPMCASGSIAPRSHTPPSRGGREATLIAADGPLTE